jgi:hypothetical protein
MGHFFLLLNMLLAGSYVPTSSPMWWHLCRTAVTSAERPGLSRCRVVGFETPHKQTLQAGYWQL